jgi:hypothetical protein
VLMLLGLYLTVIEGVLILSCPSKAITPSNLVTAKARLFCIPEIPGSKFGHCTKYSGGRLRSLISPPTRMTAYYMHVGHHHFLLY